MKRDGFTITEATAAIAIMGVVMGVALQAMYATTAAEARLHRRQLAVQETQNQLERVEVLAWDELNDDVSKSLVVSDAAKEQLKAAQVTVRIDKQAKSEKLPEAKRVIVTLTWQEPEQDEPSTVQLVTWRYP